MNRINEITSPGIVLYDDIKKLLGIDFIEFNQIKFESRMMYAAL